MRRYRIGLACCLMGVIVTTARTQITSPGDYYPLSSNSQWVFDQPETWAVNGTKVVGSHTGTVIHRQVSTEDDILFVDSEGLKILQAALTSSLLGQFTLAYDPPVMLLPAGAVAGQSTQLNISVTTTRVSNGHVYTETMTGTSQVTAILDKMTVKAGTYGPVAVVHLQGTLAGSISSLTVDRTYWLAEKVGPIKFDDRYRNETYELVSGKVAGVTIPSTTLPNLRPSTPSGWPDSVVLTQAPGVYNALWTLYNDLPVYMNGAVKNDSAINVTTPFHLDLSMDGSFVKRWDVPSLTAGAGVSLPADYRIGYLQPGNHTLAFTVNSTQAIVESNDTDNTYSRQFTVLRRNAARDWTLYR